jgi:glycyl-tRNA synthetase beta chain
MTTKNLLVELLVEELPPKALRSLGDAFAYDICTNLEKIHLASEASVMHRRVFASPRRLGVHIPGVLDRAADKSVSQKLMPVTVALDANGNPTPALLKKLASLGLGAEVIPQLRREGEGKTESLVYDSEQAGATLADGLQQALQETLAKLPIPKVMTYQLADGWSNVQFVRPAHRLVALHGADVVPVSILGLQAGRTTQGHRFEAASAALEIIDADSYEAQMENAGAVIPSFAKRRAEIARQLVEVAANVGGGVESIEDEDLLNEVTGLVERPTVMLCQFEEQFLAVPQECLILTMKANQKYFPLLDANGKLTNKFLVVSNINPADPSEVVGGNERVVRPRLADAKFFYDQDRKRPLDSRVLGLARVVYHNKLGTQGERVQRVQAIARAIGHQIGGDALARLADRAALLAKADLLTDMVGEFPELQGIMGRYYAQYDGESDEIAFAIEDHYKPRFAGDDLPRNLVGICVALADKLETLVGMFSINEVPTGDKDPYALRRHTIGIIRMLMEEDLGLSLGDVLRHAEKPFKGLDGTAYIALTKFILDRLVNLLRDEGYTALEVAAVCAPLQEYMLHTGQPLPSLADIPQRLQAVRAFSALPEAAALAAANKRVGNILKKAEDAAGDEIDPALLVEPAEQSLYQSLGEVVPEAAAAYGRGDFAASLQMLAKLKAPVDDFFDHVMVNAEDTKLRANRMALLSQLYAAMNCVADISKLAA